GGTLAQKLLYHQQTPPPAVEKVRSDLPDGLAQVVRRLLAKRPEERYQTPAELVADLDRVLGNRAGPSADSTAQGSKRPAGKLVAAVAAAASLILAVLLGWSALRQPAPTHAVQSSAKLPAPLPPPVHSLWDDSARPERPAAPDTTPVELGIKFRADV